MKNANFDKIKGFLAGILVAVLCMVIVKQAAIWLPVSSWLKDPSSTKNNVKIKQTMNVIKDRYFGDYSEEELTHYMFLGLMSGLGDKYAMYYTPEEYAEISMAHAGDYKGIGVSISETEDGAFIVESVTPESPAEKVGILPGDQITKIDGQEFVNCELSKMTDYIKSVNTDTVSVEVFRSETGETLTFDVELAALEAFSVGYAMVEDNIGYIKITSFTARTPEQFKNARTALEEEGMEALIIDLRGNLGGLVSGVVGTLENFMPEGIMVTTQYKDGSKEEQKCSGENELKVPLVLLVNQNSASASEIMAGAVKDYGVGTLIGTKTYGKGIVQDIYSLIDGSIIRLTVAKYFTPSGECIHEEGITPDIVLDNVAGKDLQFNKAVRILKEQLKEHDAA